MCGKEKDYTDLSYQETLKIIKDNNNPDDTLKFHLSNQIEHNYNFHEGNNLNDPDSFGELEEEITEP